jgi:hypothetical protein
MQSIYLMWSGQVLMIYKILHRRRKIEQNEPHKRHEGRCGEHSDAPDRKG